MSYSQKTIRAVSVVASAFGIIQGAVWLLGSLFFVLVYYNFINFDFEKDSLEHLIFEIFASEDDKTIIIFMYVYGVLSLTLCVTSSFVLNAIVAKSEGNARQLYVSWSVNMIILSVVDVVLACFMGRDLFYFSEGNISQELTEAYGIAVLISVRGIILLIINILLSGYMIVFSFYISQETQPSRRNEIINAFEEPSGVWSTNLTNNPLAKASRKSFFGDNSNKTMSYNSLIASEEMSIKSEMFETSKNQSYEDRLANIGKPGKRATLKTPSPRMMVQPPTIPREFSDRMSLTSSKGQASLVFDVFNMGDADNKNKEKVGKDKSEEDDFTNVKLDDMPYIPPPDYTPPCSPTTVPRARLKKEMKTFL